MTTPVGPTLTAIRSATSAGATFRGRSRPRSSAIRAVQKSPLLEERAFYPPDQILDAAFLLRPIRPAHLDANAKIERDAGKRRIPFGDDPVTPPPKRDRFRPIKHRDERNAAEGREMLHERAHERFDPLIGDERDLDPPRVLQP